MKEPPSYIYVKNKILEMYGYDVVNMHKITIKTTMQSLVRSKEKTNLLKSTTFIRPSSSSVKKKSHEYYNGRKY